MSLVPQYFEIREVGKTIKSTKKQYIWRFRLEGRDYTIELFTSVLSGKKKILQNGTVIFFDSKFQNAFQFPFNIGKNALNIIQHGDKFELRINNMSFSHLWENERTKRNFNFGENAKNDPYKAHDYAQNYNTSTKPTSRDQEQAMRSGQYLGSEMRSDYNQDRRKDLQYSNSDLGQNRVQAQKKVSKRHETVQLPTYDYSTGFAHGFDKYDTNIQGNSGTQQQQQQKRAKSGMKKQDSSDFWADEAFNKQAQSNQFDFNFGGQQEQPKPPQKQKEEPQKQVDIMDLLGGSPAANQGQSQGTNALDFFNDINFNAPATQQEAPKQEQHDFFGGGSQVPQAQTAQTTQGTSLFDGAPAKQTQENQQPNKQEVPVEQQKPKFVPNLGGFYTNQNDMYAMQQQQMMMQQMMMQNQMNMGMGMNQFNTGMQNPMGGNQFMTNYQQPGMGQQNYQGFVQQQQQQQPNPYSQNQNQYQQQQNYQQQMPNQQQDNSAAAFGQAQGATNTSGSTPFDMFN